MLQLALERRRRGWSQARLCALVGGISQGDLSAIENGHRRAGAGWRRKLALTFGMTEADLFAAASDDPTVEARRA